MKKYLLAGMVLAMGLSGAAHAAFPTVGSASGHATVLGNASWEITEKTAGTWTTEGKVNTQLTMNVKNKSAGTAGRFSLMAASEKYKDSDGTWLIVNEDDNSKHIKIKPTAGSDVTWDEKHNNYISTKKYAQGESTDISFEPMDGQSSLTPGKYEISMTLMAEAA